MSPAKVFLLILPALCCIREADLSAAGASKTAVRIPLCAHNLLLEAEIEGNLESFNKGLRGEPHHMVYDLQNRRFVKESQWHEYGVGFAQNLGVVPESRPAFWIARWEKPVRANLIVFTGTYPNQPQPHTAWKIEIHSKGRWITHARGVGGWYDRGRYVWGGPEAAPLEFDAIRVSVFSKDAQTPIRSIHFRGEEGISWVVAEVPPIDAWITVERMPVRAGEKTVLEALPLAGSVKKWRWNFEDKSAAEGRRVTHVFDRPGVTFIRLTFSDGRHTAQVRRRLKVVQPVEARITPLSEPVFAGRPVLFSAERSLGADLRFRWDFGDGNTANGKKVRHRFLRPGIYKVVLTVSNAEYEDSCLAIVRVHTPETLGIPAVVLDTDQKNEQDDQHYFAYALFSELDVLGVNSVHHGGGQEPINYGEILHVLELARKSGLPEGRVPFVFHGANRRLTVPPTRKWDDTEPIVTEASEAILAAARGTWPGKRVWVVPVGPCTNVASAVLQARSEGLDLKSRVRIMWLGGSHHAVTNEFNGNNDPWSVYVLAESGIEMWLIPAPIGALVSIDKRTEGHLYPDNPLGRYLKKIVPPRKKPLFDPSALAAIISMHLNLGWVKSVERVCIGVEDFHPFEKCDKPNAVRVIRKIDFQAMREDIFRTMSGRPRRLIGIQ